MQRVFMLAKHTIKREMRCYLYQKTPKMQLEWSRGLSSEQSSVVRGLYTSSTTRTHSDNDRESSDRKRKFDMLKRLSLIGCLVLDGGGLSYIMLKRLHEVFSEGSFSGEYLNQETLQDLLLSGVCLGDPDFYRELLTAVRGILPWLVILKNAKTDVLKNSLRKVIEVVKASDGISHSSAKADRAVQNVIGKYKISLSSIIGKMKNNGSFTSEAATSIESRAKNISPAISLSEEHMKLLLELVFKGNKDFKMQGVRTGEASNPWADKDVKMIVELLLSIISALNSESLNQQNVDDNNDPNDLSAIYTSRKAQSSESFTAKVCEKTIVQAELNKV